jgi:ectoine hydroxylase-related dioxygenase (phytanoyl-CoA dioxygenase family)
MYNMTTNTVEDSELLMMDNLSMAGLGGDQWVGKGLEQIKRDGYVVFERLFDEDFVKPFYQKYKERIEKPIGYGAKMGKAVDEINVAYVDYPFTLHPNAIAFAVYKPIIEIIRRYLEQEIVLSYSAVYRSKVVNQESLRKGLMKPGEFSGWHSDANLIAPGRGYRFVVSMLYFNDVEKGGGALELVRGSHEYGSEKREWLPHEIEEREKDIVEVHAPAGSVVLFDMEMIHRAGIPTHMERDIFRCSYVHDGGYGEPLVIANDIFPAAITAEDARILRLGGENTIAIPLSEDVDQEAVLDSIPMNRLLNPRLYAKKFKRWLKI